MIESAHVYHGVQVVPGDQSRGLVPGSTQQISEIFQSQSQPEADSKFAAIHIWI